MVARNESNLIFLTLYIIGVTYTFTKMIESIDDKIKYIFNKEDVDEQLKAQNLQDDIGISFRFTPTYDIEASKKPLKELTVNIENKSSNRTLYVDWDNCSLIVGHSKQSQRVIRMSPGVTRDLAVPQIPSVIPPASTLTAMVATEDNIGLDDLKKVYKANSPLINISGLEKSPLKVKRKLFKDFIERKVDLDFSLRLILRRSELPIGVAEGENKPPVCDVKCHFTIKKLPWSYAMPWNRRR
ncbi:MAG: hypothetical protein N2235_21365 [Fischerella sp.]|nr:hypothetical protein [Fischerella sp.]